MYGVARGHLDMPEPMTFTCSVKVIRILTPYVSILREGRQYEPCGESLHGHNKPNDMHIPQQVTEICPKPFWTDGMDIHIPDSPHNYSCLH